MIRRTIPVCLLVACGAGSAWAQVRPLPPETRPAEKPLPLPEFRKPAPDLLELPPVKPPEAGRVPFGVRVLVREFRITGNTVVSDADLAKIAAPFENRELGNAELEELRQLLTLHYVNLGYINSGAVIPDQRITDGVVEIRIIEGRLAQIDVEGTEHFRKDYFSDRIALHAGPPLNVVELEQGLQIQLRDPLVSSINAQLVPGERPGEAVLKEHVSEAPRYDIGVSLDNKLAPSLGEAQLTLHGALRNLYGGGDVLTADFSYAAGIPYDILLRYSAPFTARDTTLGLYYERAKSKVVQSPFDVLDITNEIQSLGLQLSQPVYRTGNRDISLGALLERRHSETSLLGEPFSFSPGVEDGKATVAVLRLTQDFVDRSRDQVVAARSMLSFGLEAFGSTVHDNNEPDSRFFAWLLQFQWVRRFGERGHELYFRASGQYANNPLLPMEQFSVGGLDSVRGFPTNQLVRDSGYTASLEYRLPVFADASGWRNLKLAAFVDTGGAKNREGPNPAPSQLTGIGLGLVWSLGARYQAEIYFADGLTNVPKPPGHNLQYDGIYFRFIAFPLRP